MKRFFERFTRLSQIIVVVFVMLFMAESYGQIGNVIWEENFNNLDNWTKSTGNGSWGWGNGELEFYKEENV